MAGMKTRNQVGLYRRLSYYESKLRLLKTYGLDPAVVSMGCWDAAVPRGDFRNPRECRRYVKRCMKYYTKKIRQLKKQLGFR